MALESDDRLLRSFDDLLEPFHAACKPASAFRIGAEQEKIGLLFPLQDGAKSGASPRALPYESGSDISVGAVLRALASEHSWHIEPGPKLIALTKNSASVTLEPGSQLELSGAPLRTLHEVADESRAHLAELTAISKKLEAQGAALEWYGLGFHPTASQADLTWVPKARYGIMREYLPTRGEYGLDMMRRTATVQANFDYPSEEVAMRMLRVALRLAPFFTAMFANAPYYEGAVFGGKSYRAKVWRSVDPDRQGLVPRVLKEGSRFSDYVEWALDAPMFLVLRPSADPNGEARVIGNTGQTFRAFMRDGFEGERATMADWLTHLNTLFPEVRLKKTLEVRGGDSTPSDLVAAPAALWTGILYDDRALEAADELSRSFGFDELEALRAEIPTKGPLAVFRDSRAADVASSMLEIAAGGLSRRRELRGDADESTYLTPIRELIAQGRCPADRLLDAAGATSWSERLAPARLR